MEDVSFRQKMDRRAVYVTALVLLACVGVTVWLYFRSTASFLSAWFSLQSFALVLLVWIGMPKQTTVSVYGIRISCTLRLLTFTPSEVISVERIDASAFPLFASKGFMGYIGYFRFRSCKTKYYVLSRAFSNLVLIKCTDGRNYVIGVPDTGSFLLAAAQRGYMVR